MIAYFTNAPTQIYTPETVKGILALMTSDEKVLVTTGSVAERFPDAFAGVDTSLANTGGDMAFQVIRDPKDSVEFTEEAWTGLLSTLSFIFTGSPRTKVLANASEYRGRLPFFNLINSAEKDPVLAPAAVRILASDFRLGRENLGTRLALERNLEKNMEQYRLYNDLAEHIYGCARRGGMMIVG